jgi:hypothetical protein
VFRIQTVTASLEQSALQAGAALTGIVSIATDAGLFCSAFTCLF